MTVHQTSHSDPEQRRTIGPAAVSGKSTGQKGIARLPATALGTAQRRMQELIHNSTVKAEDQALQQKIIASPRQATQLAAFPAQPVVQRVLNSVANSNADDRFITLVNRILKGHAVIAMDAAGKFSLNTIASDKPLSTEGSKLLQVLHQIINSDQDVDISFMISDPNVFVGGFEEESIDMTDVAAFGVNPGPRMGPSAASMLVHELHEQFRKQVHNDAMEVAHGDHAIPAEEEAVGGFREGTSPKHYTGVGIADYKQQYKYSYLDGRVVVVDVTVVNNNVTNVERHAFKNYTAWKASAFFMDQMDDDQLPEIKVDMLEELREKAKKEYQQFMSLGHSQKNKKKRAAFNAKKRELEARMSKLKKLVAFEKNLARQMEEAGNESSDESSDESGNESGNESGDE